MAASIADLLDRALVGFDTLAATAQPIAGQVASGRTWSEWRYDLGA